MKKYVDISGFNINQANRGNAALSYGAISFLMQMGLLKEGQELVLFRPYKNFLKPVQWYVKKEKFKVNGVVWTLNVVPVFYLEKMLSLKFGMSLGITYFAHYLRNLEYEAADYGGDGFSDIYGDRLFKVRMHQTFMLWKHNIPLIMLPMTIGPFKKEENRLLAHKIIKYAAAVYVRDRNYIDELNNMGVPFTESKDLSAFMLPEPWDIDIKENAIGLNVSGLAYSNGFGNLEGQFKVYPELIYRIIENFRSKGMVVYLIPHSYDCNKPRPNDDDMIACRDVYAKLTNKNNVIFVDQDLTSPQVKYVISKMHFFIGTRMHANFAAIYTNVPLFGLAYSYKFKGAFNANGLDGDKQTVMINNITHNDIPSILTQINDCYIKLTKK